MKMNAKIKLQQGDITKVNTDAIVNAANSSLLGGGGVDGAIHRAGGAAILEACREIRNRQGKCATGEAVITTAGKLSARYVIHTVGPVWTGEKEEEKDDLLANCYRNSLALALANGCKTVAFPNISTGIYHFPKKRAAQIAIKTVKESLLQYPALEEVVFVCFDQDNLQIYRELLEN